MGWVKTILACCLENFQTHLTPYLMNTPQHEVVNVLGHGTLHHQLVNHVSVPLIQHKVYIKVAL